MPYVHALLKESQLFGIIRRSIICLSTMEFTRYLMASSQFRWFRWVPTWHSTRSYSPWHASLHNVCHTSSETSMVTIAEELDTIAPESDGAIWASNDRLGSFEGCGFAFLTNLFESIDVFQKTSAALSIRFLLPLFCLPPCLRRYSSSTAQLPVCPTWDLSWIN